MGARSDPAWRDHAAAALAAEVALEEDFRGPVLLVDDPMDTVAEALGPERVVRWERMDRPGATGRPWPPSGPFTGALLRLPRSREALDFALHAALSVTLPGAPVLVYGARDEGIASTPSRIEPLTGPVQTMATAKRCRVLRGERPEEVPGLKGSLEAWRIVEPVELGWGAVPWVRYPGTFAGGGVDEGSALLLEHLPDLPGDARVLDFGAGTGILSAGILHATPGAELELVEPDALARAAAAANVPGVVFVPAAEWREGGPYRAIVSNPPYHQGKSETLTVVRELVRGAPAVLVPGGELRLVIQRRHPVEEELKLAFGHARVVADRGPYRVWSAVAGRERA